MAAKTIEPAIGASTWALGSHKCTENIGNLTRNPIMATNQKIDDEENFKGNIKSELINIILVFDDMYIDVNITNIGREAVTVYNIKYILACIRSGWYPHVIIIIIVGISEASNHT